MSWSDLRGTLWREEVQRYLQKIFKIELLIEAKWYNVLLYGSYWPTVNLLRPIWALVNSFPGGNNRFQEESGNFQSGKLTPSPTWPCEEHTQCVIRDCYNLFFSKSKPFKWTIWTDCVYTWKPSFNNFHIELFKSLVTQGQVINWNLTLMVLWILPGSHVVRLAIMMRTSRLAWLGICLKRMKGTS